MKRIITSIALLFTMTAPIYAATPTVTASPTLKSTPAAATAAANMRQIEDLKDRIATTVAQLNQTQKKAIAGTVKTVSVSTITIETKTSDIKIELTDSISVFDMTSGKRAAITTDDLSKGDSVVVFGDYDTTLSLLKAKVIYIQPALPMRVSGSVTDVDKKNYTVTLETPEKQSYVVDIEKITSMMAYDPQKGVVKGGFSKIEIGETVHVIGKLEPKEDNRISGLRVLDIGFVFGAPSPTPTPTIESTPTATVSATVKTTVKPTLTPKPTSKITPLTSPTP
jgi:hypothetical protein